MRKQIYAGDNEGFYEPVNFHKFLQELNSDIVLGIGSFGSKSHDGNIYAIFHEHPSNVTISYYHNPHWIHDRNPSTTVTLFGKKSGIGELEKLIKFQAKNFKKE